MVVNFNAESCSVSCSVAKLAIVMLLRPRCKHVSTDAFNEQS